LVATSSLGKYHLGLHLCGDNYDGRFGDNYDGR
jgi:hypothetical protein